MLKPFKDWTGPYFESNIYDYCHTDLFPTPDLVNTNTCNLLDSIFEKFHVFENMAENPDEEKYLFYFRLPKGKAEQYRKYKEMIEDGYEFKSKKDYYRLFDRWYPKKWYWFTAFFQREVYNGDTYYYIMLGRFLYLYAYDGKGKRREDKEREKPYSKVVKPLIDFADYLVEFASSPNYQNFVNKHLDYRLRTGETPYKKYWELYPEEKAEYMKYYEGFNQNDFIEYYNSGIIDEEHATRFTKLTANEYCRMFKIASLAVGGYYDENETLQENYHRNSDGRNHGLDKIEPDSSDAFDEWYKNERGGFDHTFEMRVPRCRIDLRVHKDERGYYLIIGGGGLIGSAYVMKIYLALKQNNINAYMYEPKDLIDDYLGDSYYYAQSSETYLDNFPKKKIREYIKIINWDELDLIKVKDDNKNISQKHN